MRNYKFTHEFIIRILRVDLIMPQQLIDINHVPHADCLHLPDVPEFRGGTVSCRSQDAGTCASNVTCG